MSVQMSGMGGPIYSHQERVLPEEASACSILMRNFFSGKLIVHIQRKEYNY